MTAPGIAVTAAEIPGSQLVSISLHSVSVIFDHKILPVSVSSECIPGFLFNHTFPSRVSFISFNGTYKTLPSEAIPK
tara:strand:+ start:628 stop:858 length:231 start_codon:yes stop_codon:yes gene_type:complete